ncbi:hypothetical protein RM530_06150 [Algiphilus sp. W345]|uniref:Acetohydroxy-acid synthase small subunit n=1 Tax=Banduia mediterranea TaxID=3075609 RepID=A0ABU2WIN6_9GAMM|nr:hypothetical protein [Algiphilus sp. W345]MDT0496947.1 hypothetical protein [Algiphilus sp. W345]
MSEAVSLQDVVYLCEVAERPGVVHSIAAVFAHRGLSIKALVADTSHSLPRILVAFRGTVRQCRMVEQVLRRLHHVHGVRTFPIDAPELRALAICRTQGELPVLPGVREQSLGDTSLLSGTYGAVELAIKQLLEQGLVSDVSRTFVAL